MGVGINVGVLADALSHDPEGGAYFRECFQHINELLAWHGLPLHTEPETLPPLEERSSCIGFPYSFLHHLRRAYAHRLVDPEWIAEPLPEGARASDDPVLDEQSQRMDCHLLCHSDCEGFYLPIDFQNVLIDESGRIPGVAVGSSYRLMDELVLVAPAIGIHLEGKELPAGEAEAIDRDSDKQKGVWIERLVWFSLFEAVELSLKHRTAICFS